jgi:hypothetical protein
LRQKRSFLSAFNELVPIAQAQAAAKQEMIYDYLTGSRFRLRIDAIVEKFTDTRDDLMRIWSKR